VTGTAGTSNSTTIRAQADEPARSAHATAGARRESNQIARAADKMTLKDMPPKTVALLGAVCLTTGWLLASMLTPPVAKLQSLPERRNARPAVAGRETAAAFTEQLHLKLQQAPVAPVPRRNPFTFGKAAAVASANTRRGALDMPATGGDPGSTLEVAPVISGPILSLAGIGSSESPEGLTLTAVLSDGKTVHLVKAGEQVVGYKVIAVTEDSATLADVNGMQVVLRLR
jgi:hypothetical protein